MCRNFAIELILDEALSNSSFLLGVRAFHVEPFLKSQPPSLPHIILAN